MALSVEFGGISRAFKNQNYRYYWVGGASSILGFWLCKLALGLLAWQLTYSPLWLGIIGFSATFPAAAFAPFAGAVADRYGLRKVALFALAASALVSFIIGIFVYLDLMEIELLSALVLIQGVALAFDLPSRQALVYYAVPRGDLSSAIALNTTTFHIGAFVGPGLFALLNPFFGISFAFFFNSFTFLVFAGSLMAMRLEPHSPRARDSPTIFSDMIEGIRYTYFHPGIFAVLAITLLSHLFIRPYIDLLPAFADVIFNAGANGFAMLAGASGLGSLVGGVWLSIRGRNDGLTRILCLGILGSAVFTIIFASSKCYWLGLSCMVALGFSLVIIAVASQSLIQNSVDPNKRARVISLSTGIAVGFPAVGALVLGGISEFWGVQGPTIIAGLFCLIYFLFSVRRLLSQSRSLELKSK